MLKCFCRVHLCHSANASKAAVHCFEHDMNNGGFVQTSVCVIDLMLTVARKRQFVSSSFLNSILRCGCLRVPSIRVADRLADSQGEQSLVAGVGQRVDGLGEHAS